MLCWIRCSFKRQIIVVLFSLIFLVSFFSLLQLYYDKKQILNHMLESQALQLIDSLAINIEDDVRYSNYYELSNTLIRMYDNNRRSALDTHELFQIIDISVVDLDNKTLAHTHPKEHPLQLTDTSTKKLSKLFSKEDNKIQMVWNKEHTQLYLRSSVLYGKDPIATMYMRLHATSLLYSEKVLQRDFVILIFILSVLLYIFVFFFSKWIEKPLHEIIKQIDNLGEGKITLESLTKREDEFAVLAQTIIQADTRIYWQRSQLLDNQKDLHKRVKIEVEKSQKREKHMLHQSRLAQMGELLSMIAHQWRQPLSTINSVIASIKIKFALNSFDLNDENDQEAMMTYMEQQLNQIEMYTTNLSLIINDFKDFYQPSYEKVEVKLDDTVKKALKMMEPIFKKKGLVYKENYAPLPSVYVHENEIVQVLLNIFQNALDEMSEQKIENSGLEVKVFTDKDYVFIEIYDEGKGIDAKIADDIFDPYFSTKTTKNGTGLGLYMSKIIIEDHHKGKIYLKEESAQTCFVIKIPIENAS